MNSQPLADKMRPQKIADVMGQTHVIGKNQFLHTVISKGQPVSMILWGPPGSGKTTLARIIAQSGKFEYVEISAVTTGLADVRKVIIQAKKNLNDGKQTVLFVDEIHRFNKAQQDAFLPHVEDGSIILIGATTENPSFEVIGPLLSRSRVVVLEPLSTHDIKEIIVRAQRELKNKKIDDEAIELLAELAGGDARMALNGLEAAAAITGKTIQANDIKQAMQKMSAKYDKGGEYHYNLISAYIKSMRGSDVNATLYYLARMIEGGEDPKFIARRNIIFASEDIGIAAPAALNLAVSTCLAVERIGYPECNYNLFECAVVLAKSKKSRAVADAMGKAFQYAKDYPDAPVPLHLRNAPTKLMKDLGYQKGTKWEAGFEHPDGFLPDELKNLQLFSD
jgi:putative ATPase